MARKWWVLASVACGTFMATLDSSIVNIALPTLTISLGIDLTAVKWVVIIYLLVLTCLLLPFGKLSDLYGGKRIFQTGFVVFTVGSFFCGLSSTLLGLVFSRALQATGAAMLMANGPAIVTTGIPRNERGAALGFLAMVVSAGLISGPSIGGLLIGTFGWRSIFWVNIPIGIIGTWLAYHHVPDRKCAEETEFDWLGTIFQTLFLLSFMIAFDPPAIPITRSFDLLVPRWALIGSTFIFGLGFIWSQFSVAFPLIDLKLFQNRTFTSSNVANFLTFVAFSSVSVLMPFFLEQALHYPTQRAGFFMTCIPLTVLFVAPIAGRLSDRFGSRGLSMAGGAVGAAGLIAISGIFGSGLDTGSSQGMVALGLSSIGLSLGLFQSPNNNAIMGTVPTDKVGVASAMLATVRNLGLVIGTAMTTAIFSWQLRQGNDFVGAVHTTQFIAGLISLGALVASSFKRRSDGVEAKRKSAHS